MALPLRPPMPECCPSPPSLQPRTFTLETRIAQLQAAQLQLREPAENSGGGDRQQLERLRGTLHR